MAAHLSYVKFIAGRALLSGASTVVPSAGITADKATTSGNSLVACVGIKSTSITLSGVTDDRGNTWAVDYSPAAGTNSRVFVASCLNPIGLIEGDTVTFAWSAATSVAKYVSIFEVAGVLSAAAFDKSAAASGNGTALASGATATLSQADEIAFGLHVTDGITGDTLTAGGGFTNADSQFVTGGKLYSQYQIVAATTGLNAQGTLSGAARNWASAVATYKASTVLGQRIAAAALVEDYAGNTRAVSAAALVADYAGNTRQIGAVAFVVEYDAPSNRRPSPQIIG